MNFFLVILQFYDSDDFDVYFDFFDNFNDFNNFNDFLLLVVLVIYKYDFFLFITQNCLHNA